MPDFTSHPGTKGTATESEWISMLREFLPRRYGVGGIFAVDSLGNQSEQIDVAIFDQQYSPLFFEQGNLSFVPIESIYAVFEVKPTLNKSNVDYARGKISSVRSLHRTSVEIRHAGGTYSPQDPASKPILGGILSTGSQWASMQDEAARAALLQGTTRDQIDFAIAARDGTAELQGGELSYAPHGHQLIWFAMRLYSRLSEIGSALALDLEAYVQPIQARKGE